MSLGPKCRLFSGYWNYNWAYFHVCATDFPPFSQTPWWFIAHIKPLRLSLLLLQSTGALILQYFITVINHWALKVQHRFLSDVVQLAARRPYPVHRTVHLRLHSFLIYFIFVSDHQMVQTNIVGAPCWLVFIFRVKVKKYRNSSKLDSWNMRKWKDISPVFLFVFVLRCVVLHVDSHVPRSHTDTEEDISDLMFLLLWSNLHLNNTVTVLIIFNCF